MRPEEEARRPRWWARVAIDVTPLRTSRDYRLLWFGQLISMAGTMLRFAAVPYHVFLLTESPVAVGLVGAFSAAPLIVFSLWGGVVADSVDRRRLLIVTQIGLMAVSVVLAAGTQAGFASVPFLYGVTAAGATLSALDGPARTSLIPVLVERRHIPAAMTLNQVLFQLSAVAGPALGGFVIARAGLAWAYWFDAATFAAGLAAVVALRAPTRSEHGTRPGLKALVEGLRYLRTNTILWSIMALDFVAMFFGWPRAMFPFFAENIHDVGAQGLGLLFAAPSVGALVVALGAGWVSHVRRQGLAVLASVAVWGIAVAGFGMLRTAFPVALFLLALAGAADVVSAIFRGTIVQMTVPDHLRGRITAVNLMVVISGPRLGEVESGVVAAFTSPAASVVIGGLVCVAGVAAALVWVPALARYRVEPD